jgi:hypothetical protein
MGLFSKLQNGDTVLKSLKFGNDRPGGGDSGQPYIQKPIPDALKDNNALDADFLLRGGINAPLDAFTDVKRLTKYMFSLKSPSGLLFTAKQNLLSRTAVKTEAAFGIGYAGGTLNEGIYTPLSTIAQAGVGFLGGHVNKQGLDPTGLISSLSIRKYEKVVYDNNSKDINYINVGTPIGAIALGNVLAANPLISGLNPFAQTTNFSTIGNATQTTDIGVFKNRLLDIWWNKQIKSTNDSAILQYNGGPGSTLGIGKTKINFATDGNGSPLRTGVNRIHTLNSTHITNNQFQIPLNASIKYSDYISSYSNDYVNYDLINDGLNSYQENIINNVYKSGSLASQPLTVNIYNNYKTWTQEDIVGESRNLGDNPSGIRADFRNKLNKTNSTFLSNSPDYTTNNIENKFGLRNPGQKGNISSYTKGKLLNGALTSKPLDTVNASFIYKSEGKEREEAKSEYVKRGDELKDIIPFYIAILNNDRQQTGAVSTYKKYMHFRAFIDAFSDSYDAEWKSIEYMGRAEKFYKYGGFDRKIDLSFTVVAQSRGEITAMYDKLNFLASSLAPEYLDSLSSGYMAGNIAYITLGQYINEQPGVITSLSFDIPEESPWEIGIDDEGNSTSIDDVRQVPHMIKVKLNFTPIHKFRPEKQIFRNDKSNTNSTRLLDTGGQRYIDQLRPPTTDYDKDAQEITSTITATEDLQEKNTFKDAIAKREAEKDRLPQDVGFESGIGSLGESIFNTII